MKPNTNDLAAMIAAVLTQSQSEPVPPELPTIYTVPEAAGGSPLREHPGLRHDPRWSSGQHQLGRRRLIPAVAIDTLIRGGAAA